MRKDRVAAVVAPKVDFTMKFVDGKAAITANDVKAKGESNDCVVRAVMNAFQVSYDTAHEFVDQRFNRQRGKGTKGTAFGFKQMAEGEVVLGKRVKSLGKFSEEPLTPAEAKKAGVLLNLKYPKGGGRFASFTVGKFLAQNPKGSFFILVAKHALAIRDGKVYDNMNEMDKLFLKSGRDQRKCQAIFQIVPGK
jgi:hypothetical protein